RAQSGPDVIYGVFLNARDLLLHFRTTNPASPVNQGDVPNPLFTQQEREEQHRGMITVRPGPRIGSAMVTIRGKDRTYTDRDLIRALVPPGQDRQVAQALLAGSRVGLSDSQRRAAGLLVAQVVIVEALNGHPGAWSRFKTSLGEIASGSTTFMRALQAAQ